MMGILSTLGPNFSVPWGRPAVATSGGTTGAPCASARGALPPNPFRGETATVAAAALLKNSRRVRPPLLLFTSSSLIDSSATRTREYWHLPRLPRAGARPPGKSSVTRAMPPGAHYFLRPKAYTYD